MLPSSVHRSDQGFTLIESLIIVLVIGILAAIAAPSFLATLNRSRVNDALAAVEGALKEAQREAVKRSTNCEVTLGTNSVTGPCLVTGTRTLNNVNLRSSASTVEFSFKGNTTSGNTIVLSNPDSSINQKCLAVAIGIGIMRTGKYQDNATGTDPDKCTSLQ